MTPACTIEGILAKVELARERILLDKNEQPDPEDTTDRMDNRELRRQRCTRTIARTLGCRGG